MADGRFRRGHMTGVLDARGWHRDGANVRDGVQRARRHGDRTRRLLRCRRCPPNPAAYTASGTLVALTVLRGAARLGATHSIAILTGSSARVITPLIDRLQRPDISVIAVDNQFFGSNTR